MTTTKRLHAPVMTGVLTGLGLIVAVSISMQTQAQAEDPSPAQVQALVAKPQGHTHLNSVGQRYVGKAIPIVGYVVDTADELDQTFILQRKKDGIWRNADRLFHQTDGRFRFPSRHVTTPQTTRWRVMVMSQGVKLNVSKPLVVEVVPKPV